MKKQKTIKQIVEQIGNQNDVDKRLKEGYIIKQISTCATQYSTHVYALYEKEEIITNN